MQKQIGDLLEALAAGANIFYCVAVPWSAGLPLPSTFAEPRRGGDDAVQALDMPRLSNRRTSIVNIHL